MYRKPMPPIESHIQNNFSLNRMFTYFDEVKLSIGMYNSKTSLSIFVKNSVLIETKLKINNVSKEIFRTC